MGPELAAAMMVGGTALQMKAAEDQKDERRSVLNRQLERDDAATGKAIQLVQDESGQYTMPNRLDAMQKQEDQTYQQIEADMQGAGGAMVDTASDAGNVSEDFLKTKAARAVDEGSRMTSIAREAAKARAPGSLLSEDALRRAGMAGNLQNIWGTNNNMARATGQDAEGVEAPMYGNFGKIASTLGSASLMANPQGTGQALTRLKYTGASNVPTAANYVNSMDSGIRW